MLEVEPDLGLTAANFVPNDPFYPPYQQNKHYGAINLPAAWELTTGDPNVVVQIVDTGVQRNHPDLQANIWQNPSETDCSNGVDDDGNGYVDDCYGWDHRDDDADPSDDDGHGTTRVATTASSASPRSTMPA